MVLENGWEVPLDVNDRVSKRIMSLIPITSRLIRWKEEVYFETELELELKELTGHVKRGDFAYWPPGKALCLFYGISQPYTPLIIIGEAIGTLSFLRDVEEGSIVKVDIYRDYENVKEVCNYLRKLGYKVASRSDDEGFISVSLNMCYEEIRLGLDIFVEEYGIYVESDELASYNRTLPEKETLHKIRDIIGKHAKKVRLDLNERSMLCLSACCSNLKELPELLNKFKECIKALNSYI